MMALTTAASATLNALGYARIARDLHDSAAHAIDVILVQAGSARLLQQRAPSAAQQALSTIEDVARETIGAIEPPTGLAAVHTLAERHRAAGLAVQIAINGRATLLGGSLEEALQDRSFRVQARLPYLPEEQR